MVLETVVVYCVAHSHPLFIRVHESIEIANNNDKSNYITHDKL